MEQETITTTPSTESVADEKPASQVSEPSPQGDDQKQQAETPQVEQSQQQTSSETQVERPLPSEAYKIRKLEKELRQTNKLIQELVKGKQNEHTSTPKDEGLDYEKFSKKFWDSNSSPDKFMYEYLRELEKKLEDKYKTTIDEFKQKELPSSLTEFESKRELQRKEQEALELIFKKLGANPNEKLDAKYEKHRETIDKIDQVMSEYGLNYLYAVDPVKATEKALELYEMKNSAAKKNPLAPKKGQMGSTASGTPSGGSRKASAEELIKKAEELKKQFIDDPDLRNDEKFLEQMEAAQKALAEYKEEN